MSITFGANKLAQSSFAPEVQKKVEFDWNGNPIIPGENWKQHAKKRNSDEAEMGSASDTEEESIALSELHGITINGEHYKVDPNSLWIVRRILEPILIPQVLYTN